MEIPRAENREFSHIVNEELRTEPWDAIPELDPLAIKGALDSLETALAKFDSVAKEKGRKSAWGLFHGAMQEYIIAKGLNEKQRGKERAQIETLFLLARMLQNELQHREVNKHAGARPFGDTRSKKAATQEAISQTKHLAEWKNRLAIFILSQRGLSELSPMLERLWHMGQQLAQKVGLDKEFIGRQERGIARVVSTSELFRHMGHHVFIPTSTQDAIQKVDLWTVKPQSENPEHGVIIGGIQIKPQGQGKEGISLQVIDYEQGQLTPENREEIWKIAACLRTIKAGVLGHSSVISEVKPLAIFAHVPSAREFPDDIQGATGILTSQGKDRLGANIDKNTKTVLNVI